MLEKGRKRQERPVAVVYFVIGLIVLLGILAILYFALFEVDYSDQIRDPESTMRAYVETTPVPEDYESVEDDTTPVPEMLTEPEPTEYVDVYAAEGSEEDAEDALTEAFNDAEGDLTQTDITPVGLEAAEDGTPDAAAAPVEQGWTDAETLGGADSVLVTPEPTPLVLETPVPTEEPMQAEEPDMLAGLDSFTQPSATTVPAELIAQAKTSGFSVPAAASDGYGKFGITRCDVSEADNKAVMHIVGYGYRDLKDFDGARCKSYLVVTQKSNGNKRAYQLNLSNGITGLAHASAQCQNASASDFECYISVRDYDQDIYNIALVLQTGKKKFFFYPLDSSNSFTVVGAQVVSPLTASMIE